MTTQLATLFLSLVLTVIVASPAETPVTTPLLFTVATPVLFDDHVTALFVALLGVNVGTNVIVSSAFVLMIFFSQY